MYLMNATTHKTHRTHRSVYWVYVTYERVPDMYLENVCQVSVTSKRLPDMYLISVCQVYVTYKRAHVSVRNSLNFYQNNKIFDSNRKRKFLS